MEIEPAPVLEGRKIAVVAARFNEEVTRPLLAGALARLSELGFGPDSVDTLRVPGAFEVPSAAKRLAETGRYASIVCLGAIIRGETPHFDHISAACSRGIMDVSLATGVPAAFGVLTCDTEEQALARVGGAMGHKGAEAAEAAVEMARLFASLATG